jgi:SAM-dependent methyltransferase
VVREASVVRRGAGLAEPDLARLRRRIVTKGTDRGFLTGVAYADGGGLTDRAALYDFQQPRIDLVAEALGELGAVRGQLVIDVGCGTGRYLPGLDAAGAAVIALDLSEGMLTSMTSRGIRTVGCGGLRSESLRTCVGQRIVRSTPGRPEFSRT